MSKKSPMSLSLEYLNLCGWTCQIVEKWNPHARIRQDCFGFGDILAYHRRKGMVALIQTTSASNFTARRKKIMVSPHRDGWKASFGKIILHGWGPKGLREEML